MDFPIFFNNPQDPIINLTELLSYLQSKGFLDEEMFPTKMIDLTYLRFYAKNTWK
jgi:hypothetical protein